MPESQAGEDIHIGRTLKGRYRIYDKLGKGGAATVYLARDIETGQMVVVKVVHSHLVDDKFMARFEREIDLLQEIDCPNIIRLYAWGLREQDEDLHEQMSYVVTEFVQGHALSDIIATRGKIDEEVALAIAGQLALALKEIHARGVLHRDVKSPNVMITPENDAKLIDFGIAKGPDHATLTMPATFEGTVCYAPPEQMLETHDVDHRADLYALGIVLYEMLMGHLPVQEKEFGTIVSRVMTGDLDPITGVSQAVEELVQAMIAYNVEDRIDSAEEVIKRIEAIIDGEPAQAAPEQPAGADETVISTRVELIDRESPSALTQSDVVKLGYTLTTVSGRPIPLEKLETILGRGEPGDAEPPDVDLRALGVPNARTVSRRHCRVFLRGGEVFLEDLGSTNGTWLNSLQLSPGQPIRLTGGDHIAVGSVLLVFGDRKSLMKRRNLIARLFQSGLPGKRDRQVDAEPLGDDDA